MLGYISSFYFRININIVKRNILIIHKGYFKKSSFKNKNKDNIMAADEQQFIQLLEGILSLDNTVRQQAEVSV